MKITEKEQKILNEINNIIPDVFAINSIRAGNENEVHGVHFSISAENKDLSNSEYYYRGTSHFLHFTSLLAIQSIVTEKNIRLYNLNNLNDPREYSFAGDLITFNKEDKTNAKNNIFLLSMCQMELLNSTETEFNMWRLYGANGQGVAIELNFEESPSQNWRDYFLSKVHYGSNSKTNLKELNKLLKQLDKEKPKVSVDLGQIVCFHKSRLFGLEEETRLLFDGREFKPNEYKYATYRNKEGELISPFVKTDIYKSTTSNKEIKFLELPIYHTNFKKIYSENSPIPIPKIDRIILGYQYKENFKKVAKALEDLCQQQLGYIPKIEKSHLTKYYHDIK